MIIICVTTDSKFPVFLQPFYIGFTLLAIGSSMGGDYGYALNPVRVVKLKILKHLIIIII